MPKPTPRTVASAHHRLVVGREGSVAQAMATPLMDRLEPRLLLSSTPTAAMGGGDESAAVIDVRAKKKRRPPKSNIQLTNGAFVVPGATGDVPSISFNLTRKAASARNELGVIPVALDGNIDGLAPGDSGYVEALLNSPDRQVLFRRNADRGDTAQLSYENGKGLVFYLITKGTTEAFLNGRRNSEALFTNAAINPGGEDFVREQLLGDVTRLNWENKTTGRKDFRDIVLDIVPGSTESAFSLTVLHNNDGESQLINAGSGLENFGGAARFTSVVKNLRNTATTDGVVTLSSGDNFLAGPEFTASLNDGVFYDARVLNQIGYDAIDLGNHDFDFGPDVLADFIDAVDDDITYLSSNLDFSGEAALQGLADAGRIAPSVVVEKGGQQIGIIGATTPQLPFISSPRDVALLDLDSDGDADNDDVRLAVQQQVTTLEGQGVNKIILISHLQNINEELALVGGLRGVDIVIAGGGDELLANADDVLIPGDTADGSYPIFRTAADGSRVPVVTTSGNYKYVGQLVVNFDAAGKLIFADGGPVVVDNTTTPDTTVQNQVVNPVSDFVADLDTNVIADSEVALDGLRDSIRNVETNLGNLIADSFLWQANQLAGTGAFADVPQATVALQNGGGVRNDTVIAAGDITELDTFDILPFSNFLTVVEAISPAQFKQIMENAVSALPGGGRFAQIAGFTYEYDLTGAAQVLDADGNVTTPGTRIRTITLDDGTPIVANGSVVAGAPAVNIATIDFLARGGDQYPFRGAAFTNLGVSYQQALANYLIDAAGLDGTVTAADYPEGGEGRITALA